METSNWIDIHYLDQCWRKGTVIMLGKIDLFIEIGIELASYLISVLVSNAYIKHSTFMSPFDDLDLFLIKWAIEEYLGHSKTVYKHSQVWFISKIVCNWLSCCVGEQ